MSDQQNAGESVKAGTLLGIARREQRRAPMETLDTALVTTESGVENDSRGKPSSRQVSVLSQHDWHLACAEVSDEPLPWTVRRANLLIEGFDFSEADVGKEIHIGDLVLKINKETDPCFRMDEQCDGLQEALKPDWRGGVCCTVVVDGAVKIGDSVEVKVVG